MNQRSVHRFFPCSILHLGTGFTLYTLCELLLRHPTSSFLRLPNNCLLQSNDQNVEKPWNGNRHQVRPTKPSHNGDISASFGFAWGTCVVARTNMLNGSRSVTGRSTWKIHVLHTGTEVASSSAPFETLRQRITKNTICSSKLADPSMPPAALPPRQKAQKWRSNNINPQNRSKLTH